MYIIIINYNNWQDTIECVQSLCSSDFTDFQVIIVDNCSPNDSVEKLLEYFEGKETNEAYSFIHYRVAQVADLSNIEPYKQNKSNQGQFTHPVLFFESAQNLGFAQGNNLAIKFLLNIEHNLDNDTKIFLLNPDTLVTNSTLSYLNEISEKRFISSCQIIDSQNNSDRYFGAYKIIKPFGHLIKIKESSGSPQDIDFIYGGAMLTNIGTIRETGLMPADYFLYWEESDWCYSAKLKGVKLLTCVDAIVYDKVGTSIGRGFIAFYYYCRNCFIFYKKFFPYYVPILFMTQMLKCLNKIRKGQMNAAKGFYRGIVDFIKGKTGQYLP